MNRVTAIRAIKNSNNNAKCQSQMTYAEVTKKPEFWLTVALRNLQMF